MMKPTAKWVFSCFTGVHEFSVGPDISDNDAPMKSQTLKTKMDMIKQLQVA